MIEKHFTETSNKVEHRIKLVHINRARPVVNVKLDVSGKKEDYISRLETSLVYSSFLIVQLKQSWQYCIGILVLWRDGEKLL